jgi:DNA-binding SARP family transcriptional activator/TolB-like protein
MTNEMAVRGVNYPPSGHEAASRSTDQPVLIVRVTLFGRMRVEDATGRSLLPHSRKARGLLAILALSPNRAVLRSRVTTLLWSLRGKEQGRASLRQSVHELQQALNTAGSSLLRADRNHLALSHDCFWVDALAFTRATPSRSDLLDLFCRPFLEDLQGLDPAFDHWLADQSVRLAQIARTIGETILGEQRESGGVLDAAEQLLRIDPAHEGAWRAVIGIHLEHGDQSAALAAYERCRSALIQHGQLVPSHETDILVDGIRLRRAKPSVAPSSQSRGDPGFRSTSVDRGVRVGVVPLRRIEPGAENELALALVEEITTALAQFRWITCVTNVPSTDVVHDDRQDWLRQPTSDLDFLLDGTLQRNGSRIRIIMRLSDIRAGGTLVWAHRFDRCVSDIFALQDDIASETVAQIDMALLLWEGERARAGRRADPDAIELMLGAIPSIYRLEQNGFRDAGNLLETSMALDPSNASVHAWLAYWHLILVGQGWAPDAAAATARAAELAERAVGLDARDARAMTLAGHVRGFLGKRPEEGRALHDRAIGLNPNLPIAWCFSGLAHSYLGDHAEATRRIHQAQRLAPHDPHGFFFDTAQIMPNLLLREFEAAVTAGRRAIALNPGFSSSLKAQLAALGHLGREHEAADVRGRLLVLEPDFCVRDAATRSPMLRSEDIDTYADGLRRAGLPE